MPNHPNPFMSPEKIRRRLKFMLYGPSGSGKTWFGLKGEKPIAVLDLEGGAALYQPHEMVGGFDRIGTKSIKEIDNAIRFLEQDSHYNTVVFDPITVYYELLQEAFHEVRVRRSGHSDTPLTMSDWGMVKRHYKSLMTRLVNLDKHVVIICREKDLVEETASGQMRVVGTKPDTEKSTPYLPDIILHLEVEKEGSRKARVHKDRTGAFATGQVIENPCFDLWKGAIASSGRSEQLGIDDELAHENADQLDPDAITSRLLELIAQIQSMAEWSAWGEHHADAIKRLPKDHQTRLRAVYRERRTVLD